MGDETKVRGAGGTPGGLGQFVIGFVMTVAGGYLLTSQVTVAGGIGLTVRSLAAH